MHRARKVAVAVLLIAGSVSLLWPVWTIKELAPSTPRHIVSNHDAGRAFVLSPPWLLQGSAHKETSYFDDAEIRMAPTVLPCIATWIPAFVLAWSRRQ